MTRYSRLDFKTALPQIEGDVTDINKEVKTIQETLGGLLDFFYPVGTIYETDNEDFDPNVVWGGTWEKIEGKVLVGFDLDDTDFNSTTKTGGAKGAWRHSHDIQMWCFNGQTHSLGARYGIGYQVNLGGNHTAPTTEVPWSAVTKGSTNNTLNADKANMPPYQVVVIWKRTA